MANRRKKIARKAGITDHFLISQTDNRRSDEIPPQGERTRETLLPAYPGLPDGPGLRQRADEAAIESPQVAAMVLGPGEAAASEPDAAQTDPLPRIAACLDDLCRREQGAWGVEDTGLLAAVWPGRSAEEALQIARRLQEEIASTTGRQVRAGVAAYPTLDFPPGSTLDNARKALDHAAFFGPDSRVAFDAVSLNISGDALYERGEVQAAVREFRHGLELDPGSVNLHNSLGVCYAVLREYERALEEFTAALRLQPDDHMAVYNLGLVHALLGRKDTALGFFSRANDLRGDVFEILLQTGKLHLEQGQPQIGPPLPRARRPAALQVRQHLPPPRRLLHGRGGAGKGHQRLQEGGQGEPGRRGRASRPWAACSTKRGRTQRSPWSSAARAPASRRRTPSSAHGWAPSTAR